MKRKFKLLNSKTKTSLRRDLRHDPTKSEELAWRMLRNRHFGFKFRRQYSIGSFVVDFCCPELRLVVEIDGSSHFNDDRYKKDQLRQKYIEDLGFVVIRYPADYVLNNPDKMYEDLKNNCSKLTSLSEPSPYPLPGRERG